MHACMHGCLHAWVCFRVAVSSVCMAACVCWCQVRQRGCWGVCTLRRFTAKELDEQDLEAFLASSSDADSDAEADGQSGGEDAKPWKIGEDNLAAFRQQLLGVSPLCSSGRHHLYACMRMHACVHALVLLSGWLRGLRLRCRTWQTAPIPQGTRREISLAARSVRTLRSTIVFHHRYTYMHAPVNAYIREYVHEDINIYIYICVCVRCL